MGKDRERKQKKLEDEQIQNGSEIYEKQQIKSE